MENRASWQQKNVCRLKEQMEEALEALKKKSQQLKQVESKLQRMQLRFKGFD